VTSKSYYDLLGVDASADLDAIKHAFRREMSRYHPDKVNHLAREFQDMASARALELTQAYGVLVDDAKRAAYDRSLRGQGSPSAPEPVPSEVRKPEPEHAPPPTGGRSEKASGSSPDGFLKKVAIERLRGAVESELGDVEYLAARGFDMAVCSRPRWALFKKSVPALKVLGRVVARADAESVQEAWALATRITGQPGATPCVFLMADGLAPARELAEAIAVQRRRQPKSSNLVVVPIDLRNWQALIPSDAPAGVRGIAQRLKDGSS
jgi:curved DNA-binding protein CbpA